VHGDLVGALCPDGDGGTSVGDTVRQASAGLGTEMDWRGIQEVSELVCGGRSQ
jgi:hypothetical protein